MASEKKSLEWKFLLEHVFTVVSVHCIILAYMTYQEAIADFHIQHLLIVKWNSEVGVWFPPPPQPKLKNSIHGNFPWKYYRCICERNDYLVNYPWRICLFVCLSFCARSSCIWFNMQKNELAMQRPNMIFRAIRQQVQHHIFKCIRPLKIPCK